MKRPAGIHDTNRKFPERLACPIQSVRRANLALAAGMREKERILDNFPSTDITEDCKSCRSVSPKPHLGSSDGISAPKTCDVRQLGRPQAMLTAR
jgi:hypothetical protein